MERESFIWSWLTYGWLVKNMGVIICVLILAVTILFIFPLLLGYDIRKETDNKEKKTNSKETME